MAEILTQRAEEGKTFTITASFKDPADGSAVTPNSPLTWSLTDASGNIVNNREDVSVVPASSIQVTFSGDDLVVNSTYGNIRRWVFTGTFDGVDGNDLPLDSIAIFEIIPSVAGVGSGTTGTHPNIYQTYMTLPDYWDFLQINECAGWGIRNYPNESSVPSGCGKYWNQDARYWLSAAISKVENRLESDRWLGFPIKRKYYGTTQLEYKFPTYLGKHLRAVGYHTTKPVVLSKNITLSCNSVVEDPVVIQTTVDFSSAQEILVCYPGTTFPITPSSVSISGTIATIKIPRCRLLKPEYHINYQSDNDRPNYQVDSYFLEEVDIYRDYVDITTGSNLVWWRHKGALCCTSSVFVCDPVGVCSDIKQLACPYIINQRLGAVQFEPATYSFGWSKTTWAVKRNPDGIETNYMRGYYDRYEEISADLKRAIVAMAHNNMPRKWCSCDQQSLYWDDDTRPLEPPVRLKSGRSTWGLYEAEMIIREFDADRYSHKGGLM